jgi:hypothetical protein
MPFTPSTIAALVIAASFAAGLNVYATVLTLGLLAHAHWVALPPGLETLSSWWIIGVSGTLFAVEFVADKIPGLDLLWNGLHTFIRVPVAALLAYRATTQLTPGDAAAGHRNGRCHCFGRTWLQDSGAGVGHPQSGAGVEHCPEQQ